MINLTPKQLRRAADLQERILALQDELNGLLGTPVETPAPVAKEPKKKARKKLSAASKANMRKAAQDRWAKIKAAKAAKAQKAEKKA